MSISRVMVRLACASLLAAAVGCQATPGGGGSAKAPQRAIVATTGQGNTAVFIPSGDGVAVLASDKAHKCAQCEADAAAYFKTGAIDPKCAACGAIRSPVSGTN